MNNMAKAEAGKSHHLALGTDVTGSDNNLFFRQEKRKKNVGIILKD